MNIKKIGSGSHVFVEQLRELLSNTFPRGMVFKASYFIGEDTDTGIKGLYFELVVSKGGLLYMNFMELKDWEKQSDIEKEFFARIVNDLMMAGVAHLSNNAVSSALISDQVLEPNFKNVLPRRLIFLN
jgi:hypothetical protein